MSAPELPAPVDPTWPRYCDVPFPPYRYVPRRTPHPRKHPDGHMYGQSEELPPPMPPEAWRECEDYLYGVDLYNHAYWWEAHEALEGLWKAVGKFGEQGQFLQGLIQVGAAHLNDFLGRDTGAQWLYQQGLQRLATVGPDVYMGLDVRAFEREVRAYAAGERAAVPLIVLELAA